MLWGRLHALGETACSGGDCMLWGRLHAPGETACSEGDCIHNYYACSGGDYNYALGETACLSFIVVKQNKAIERVSLFKYTD